jgi:site-specific recombinase XerD
MTTHHPPSHSSPADVDSIARTPHVPELDGRHLVWLVDEYLDDRRARVDAATARSYACRLRLVTEWWQVVGPSQQWRLRAASLVLLEQHLRAHPSANSGQPLAYTYRKGILQSLRETLRWAYDHGYVKNDYSGWVPAAYGAKKRRRAANEGELLRLLEECNNSPRRIRDRAIIAIFVGMGLRCAEVANLNVENLHFAEDGSGYAEVVGKRTKANPSGERDAAFDVATGKLVADHLATLAGTSGPLFVSYRNRRTAPYTLYGIVKKLIQRAGLAQQIQGCHDLRRAFTTYYARQKTGGASADLRRRQLGHTSYSQTTEYTLYEVDDIRQDIVSPVGLLALKLL